MTTPNQNFFTQIKIFIKKVCHKIPIGLRHRLTTLLWNYSHQLKKTFNPICPKVFIFKGLEKNSKTPLTFAYIGPPSQTQEYWLQATLDPGFQKHLLGRRFFKSIIPFLKENYLDCNFLLIECNPLTLAYFSKKPGFNIPRWVNMEIDLSVPVEKLLGSERSEIKRMTTKNQLTYEMTKEPRHLDDFYHHMYLPYIQSRYKSTAMINEHLKILKMLYKGELMLIKKQEAVIAGGLLEFRDKNAYFRVLGIRDGKLEHVQSGAIGALYYFITIEIQKRGYKRILIGGRRPLLSDGLTKFKKSIKANLISNDHNDRIWFKLLKDSPSLQSFLINNPFIFYKKDTKPHRAVFMEAKEACSQEELKKALRISACKGIRDSHLFIFHNIKNSVDYANLLPDPSFTAQSAKELFSS